MLINYNKLVKENKISYSEEQAKIIQFLEVFDKKNKFFSKIRGAYIYGKVGRGKSMLMDLYYDNTRVDSKRRVHFHAFMQMIHQLLHKTKTNIVTLVAQLFKESKLLCFDELCLEDIGSAMVVKSLLLNIVKSRGLIIITSNYHPDELYKEGLNRESFLEAINIIKERLHILHLTGAVDYRIHAIKSEAYFVGRDNIKLLRAYFAQITNSLILQKQSISAYGRKITLENFYDGICWLTFEELFEGVDYGPHDYHLIAKKCKVIFLDFIPVIENKNTMKKFIVFIDEIYEAKCYLLCAAVAMPDELINLADFPRTVSRLKSLTQKLPNFS